jgi:hypothetical protein
MHGTLVGKWLSVFAIACTAPAWGQDAKQDKGPKKAVEPKQDVKQDAKKESPKDDKKDAKPQELRVSIDYSEVPEHKEWAEKAKALVETWHPKIEEMLKSDGYTAPRDIRVVFKKNQKTIAFASGKTISISGDWITKHPDDFGMVAHELTHIIQSYRGAPKGSGWLVEGIADYIRFYKYEPDAKIGKIRDLKKAKYTDSYRVTAQFLAYIVKTHDKDIVVKLNRALREREYQVGLFKRETGKTVDELWNEFIESLTKASEKKSDEKSEKKP